MNSRCRSAGSIIARFVAGAMNRAMMDRQSGTANSSLAFAPISNLAGCRLRSLPAQAVSGQVADRPQGQR